MINFYHCGRKVKEGIELPVKQDNPYFQKPDRIASQHHKTEWIKMH